MTRSRRTSVTPAVLAGALLLVDPMLAMAQTAPAAHTATHWIVLAAVIPGALFVLGIIAISLYFAYRQERERLLAIERLVEKSLPVPRELLRPHELPPAVRRRLDRHHAIMLLCLGLGGGLTLWLVTDQWRMAAWALIFLFLSAGKFINWYLSGGPDSAQEHAPGT